MSGYKGRTSPKSIERNFPHIVEMLVPEGDFGKWLDAMYEFHVRHGIKPQRGHGKHDAQGAVVRWCFADKAMADSFRASFVR